jgi:hypothetical protein
VRIIGVVPVVVAGVVLVVGAGVGTGMGASVWLVTNHTDPVKSAASK